MNTLHFKNDFVLNNFPAFPAKITWTIFDRLSMSTLFTVNGSELLVTSYEHIGPEDYCNSLRLIYCAAK